MTTDELWNKYKECVMDKYGLSDREMTLAKMCFYNGMISYSAFKINSHNENFAKLLDDINSQVEDIQNTFTEKA